MAEDDVISVQEAAGMLGLDPMTVRRMVKAGKIKALKNPITHRVFVRRDDVEAQIAARAKLVPFEQRTVKQTRRKAH